MQYKATKVKPRSVSENLLKAHDIFCTPCIRPLAVKRWNADARRFHCKNRDTG